MYVVNTTKRGTVNWAKWFKVQLQKEMIAISKKAKKVGNSLIGPVFTLVAKHYVALEYIEEDEEEPIAYL